MTAPQYQTHCSQCGQETGPGDSGYSHCRDHTPQPDMGQVLAYLRSNLRTPDDIIAALNAMCASQDGVIARHLAVCSERIAEDTPDVWEPELPEPNNGRGEFDRASGAMPLWMMLTGGQS